MPATAEHRPTLNRKNMVERKNIVLHDAKLDEENGSFEGYASVFNEKDLQGDIVRPGAFSKTIDENGGLFVLLDQHDYRQEIGLVKGREDEKGLFVEGKFYIDPQGDEKNELRKARDTYVKMKRRQEAGKPLQFSIGYRAINPKFEKGARILREVGLAEVSTVTFPAAPNAVTTAVKADQLDLKDFDEAYRDALERRLPWMALDIALMFCYDLIYDFIFAEMFGDAGATGDLDTLRTDLSQFLEAVMANVQQITGLTDEQELEEMRAHLERRHKSLSTLMEASAEPTEPPEDQAPAHSEDSDAGKAGAEALLGEVARLRDKMESKSEAPRPDPVREQVLEQARKIRARVKESHYVR